MRPCEVYRNPIRRDGTSQLQRLLPTMEPDYVKIDERNLFDLLNYAYRYAEYIKYYNTSQDPEAGTTLNWQPFFENDFVRLSFVLGRNNIERSYLTAYSKLKNEGNEVSFSEMITFATELLVDFDLLLNNKLVGDSNRSLLNRIITENLASLLNVLISYDKALDSDPNFGYTWNPDGYKNLSENWIIGFNNWDDYLASISGSSIMGVEFSTELATYVLDVSSLKHIDSVVNNGMLHLILPQLKRIEDEFDLESSSPNHDTEPFFALFLAFLDMFRHVQDQLNEVGGKHLAFYYEELLQLRASASQPDKVHVLFSLAKDINQQLLEKGSLLKAGKDATGLDVVFETNEGIVINKAKVEAAKAVYLDGGLLHYNQVANSKDGFGDQTDKEPWSMFGDSSNTKLAEVGFAIASPQLLMREGNRAVTIEITLNNAPEDVNAITDYVYSETEESYLSVFLSGEENWVKAIVTEVTALADKLTISFELGQEAGSVVAYNQSVLGNRLKTKYPVMKVLLSSGTGHYAKYSKLKIKKFRIFQNVQNVSNIIVQNDEGVLDASKPFFPFTNTPRVNASFYIGSTEVFQKKLLELRINLLWMGLPTIQNGDDELATLYAGYSGVNSETIDNSYFTTRLAILRNYGWIQLSMLAVVLLSSMALVLDYFLGRVAEAGEYLGIAFTAGAVNQATSVSSIPKYDYAQLPDYGPSLFVNNTVDGVGTYLSPVRIMQLGTPGFSQTESDVELPDENYDRVLTDVEVTSFESSTSYGFVRLELEKDFMHSQYPNLLTNKTILKSKSGTPDAILLPNAPYTPMIKAITLDYQSELVVDYTTNPEFATRVEQIFIIDEFGESEIFPVTAIPANPAAEINYTSHLFPQLTAEVKTNQFQAIGNLYLGLKDMQIPETVSLLFQFAEGTEDPDAEPPTIAWSYLSNNQWKSFPSENVDDRTSGLISSGIVKLTLPEDAYEANTKFDTDLVWLKIAAYDPAAGTANSLNPTLSAFSKLIKIHEQAVEATFKDQNNDPSRLQNPLQSGLVSKLVERNSAIRSIEQPYPSYGGKLSEEGSNYFVRISERLRHKNRSLTMHDYERLVLAKFPEIFKVKCINHYADAGTASNYSFAELAPGNVTLIIIPNPKRFTSIQNPYELKASVAELKRIEEYLITLAPKFAKINVRNPVYEPLSVEADIVFQPGFDPAYYSKQVSLEIKKFVAPWASGEIEKITFGGKLDASVLINLIEELSYVNYITDFKMYLNGVNNSDKEEVIVSHAASILTTNITHTINNILY